MKTKVTTMIVAIMAVILLLVSGCATNNQTPEPQDNIESIGSQDQSTSEPDNTVEETTSATDSPLYNEFKNFIDAKGSIQFKINYDMTTTTMNYTVTGKMAQYVKDTKARTDYSIQGIESRGYVVGDEYTSCSKVSNQWNCIKIEQEENAVGNVESDFKDNPSDYELESDGTKLVANINAKCYKMTSKKDSTIVRYCFSSDGVPLYVYMEAPEIKSELTAMSYSKTVLPTDFDLPAPAATIESGKAGDPCMACNYLSGDMKTQCLASC